MKSNFKTPVNLLLADDDKDDRFFFKKALEQLPIATQFNTVSDGEKLLDYLSQNIKQLPDVLFLDLNMPRKNGLECLKEIKENKKLNRILVIIYSTSLRMEVADELYQYGAHYYLHKCDFTILTNEIERVLALLAKNNRQPPRDKFVISNPI